MLTKEDFKKIVSRGVGIIEYLLLYYLNTDVNIDDLLGNAKIMGITQMMIAKGWVVKIKDNLKLTSEGLKVINSVNITHPTVNKEVVKISLEDEKCEELRNYLSNILNERIGKRQIKGFGNTYFIPTSVELKDHLKRFWKKYPKMNDINTIKEKLKEHIETCCKTGNFAPAIKYFIVKEGSGSRLANAYEEETEESTDKIVKPLDTKNLF
jgi:hypothetical protein